MRSKSISKAHQKQLQILGCYLRELRLNSGFSQKELGDQLNMSRRTIARIEQGKNFTILTAMELSDALGVDILPELFEGL
jgi:transcriptional regulator with XRE-family HTH domain